VRLNKTGGQNPINKYIDNKMDVLTYLGWHGGISLRLGSVLLIKVSSSIFLYRFG